MTASVMHSASSGVTAAAAINADLTADDTARAVASSRAQSQATRYLKAWGKYFDQLERVRVLFPRGLKFEYEWTPGYRIRTPLSLFGAA